MAQKRQHPSSPTANPPQLQDRDSVVESQSHVQNARLFESLPIHDRGSVFIAIFSTSPTHINNPKLLQAHEPFKDAMHRMLAYRRESKQKSLSFQKPPVTASKTEPPSTSFKAIYATASDEDGEKYAGKKLEKLLVDLNVEGVVVVARWYGGVLLGPVRFDHIVNVAKDAIRQWRDSMHGDGDERGPKRTKLEGGNAPNTGPTIIDEAKEKERLVRILGERDTSVDVLRRLLAEKGEKLRTLEKVATRGKEETQGGGDTNNDTVYAEASSSATQVTTRTAVEEGTKIEDGAQNQGTAPTSSAATSSPSAKLDYQSMPLQRLKQLEKARDASIGWILKQIDATEIKIKEAERNVAKSQSN